MRWTLLFLVLITGCVQQRGQLEFVQVVHDHKIITTETSFALIRSIWADVEKMREAGTLTTDIEKGARELVERLEVITRQSTVISDYVSSAVVDEELMARLIKARWKGR